MAETTRERQLHELEERYHDELMDDEERQLLLDRAGVLRVSGSFNKRASEDTYENENT